MRLLHAARLSRLADGATGLEKQDDSAQRYADAYGHTIMAVAADTDVSGSVAPWERPKLGPWLERHGEYDGIIASHLDRLGRNARHLTDLHRWAEDHGKALITVEPSVDWSSEVGKLIWQIMAWLSEQELMAITRRNTETQAWLRANGYLVGKAPFGYRIAGKGDHKTLEPDPVAAPIVVELAERHIRGESMSALAAWLTQAAPRPGDGFWWPETVSKLLRNPIYAGRRKDGLSVPRVIPAGLWAKVQAEHKRRQPAPRSAPAGDTLLSALLRCGKCYRPMYKHNARGVLYYVCRNKRAESRCGNAIRAAVADGEVEASVLAFGHLDYCETRTVPGNGHDDEISEIETSIHALDFDAPDYGARHAALVAERARLKALPAEPARTELVPTGQTVAHRWEALDVAGKRKLLIELGYDGESDLVPGMPRMTATSGGRGRGSNGGSVAIETPPIFAMMERLSGQSVERLLGAAWQREGMS